MIFIPNSLKHYAPYLLPDGHGVKVPKYTSKNIPLFFNDFDIKTIDTYNRRIRKFLTADKTFLNNKSELYNPEDLIYSLPESIVLTNGIISEVFITSDELCRFFLSDVCHQNNIFLRKKIFSKLLNLSSGNIILNMVFTQIFK